MILLLILAIAVVLVCGGGILGFMLAVYVFRPRHLANVLAVLNGAIRHHQRETAVTTVGLVIAAVLPVVAGLAYAVSGASLFVQFLGAAGAYFWVWVAGAFTLGFLLGLILRGEAGE